MDRKILIIRTVIILFLVTFVLAACSKKEETIISNEGGEGMKISSQAFRNNEMIPSMYTCDGENINPPLTISDLPKEAQSLVLIMDDPDAPRGTWVHWLVWNIGRLEGDRGSIEIEENVGPANRVMTGRSNSLKVRGAVEGITSFGKSGYGGPCPPSGRHRYFFKTYALDTTLNLPESADKTRLEKAMQGHILAKTELIGLYER